jgi:hypothetical protein
MLKLAPRGHNVLKMNNGYQAALDERARLNNEGPTTKSVNLFADSTVPSFFR